MTHKILNQPKCPILALKILHHMNPRVSEYIAGSAEFAQPILTHIRRLVHEACPEVEETIKWSFPHFEYKGVICSMAAFKQHCAMAFWKAPLMKDPHGILNPAGEGAMGHMGRITGIKDLPSDQVMVEYIREAIRLNEAGEKRPARTRPASPVVAEVPESLRLALDKNPKAKEAFEQFSPSAKKEYIEWIVEARTDTTREKRLADAIKWISEGKKRNWKYER